MAELPAHIAFTQALTTPVRYNLSHSCAQTLALQQLLSTDQTRALSTTELSYSSIQGATALRQSIAQFHLQLNPNSGAVKANNITTFCGAQEALSCIYQSLLKEGDEAIIISPCYPSLMSMVELNNANIKTIALQFDQQWQLDLDELGAAFNNKTRLLVINSPHNPSGSVVNKSQREAILALVKKYNCYLLSDDVSQASNPNGIDLSHNYLSYAKAVCVSVMSKSLGLGGVRIGWTICKDEWLNQQLLAYKTRNSICTSTLDEQLAIAALQNQQVILERNNAILRKNTVLFEAFILKHSKLFEWHAPTAGLLSLVKLNSTETIETWCKNVAEKTGVLLLPATLFGLDGKFFRLGLGQKNFAEGLAELDSYLSQTH